MKIIGMENSTISVSNHKYEILHFCELEIKYQKIACKEFDYLSDTDMEETSGYFVYRKQLYNLSDFMLHGIIYKYGNSEFRADGIKGDSYFSAMVVEYNDTGEFIRIANIYS